MISPPVIAPIEHLDSFCTGKTQICYATVAEESEKYRDFYIRKSREGKTVILDFSPGLVRRCTSISLLSKSLVDIKPAGVILPDFDFLGKKTLEASLNFMEEVFTYSFLRGTVAVLQGKNIEELQDCYEGFRNSKVTTIGLPPSLEKIDSRNNIIKDLGITHPIVLIEVFRNFVEECPVKDSGIVMMWTSLPFRLAYLGKTFDSSYHTFPPSLDFYNRESLPLYSTKTI